MTAYFIQPILPYDFESAKLPGRRAERFLFPLDQPAQSRVANRLAKRLQFLALALDDQFHATVTEVAHRARDLKSRRQRLHAVAKSNSLHAAGVKDSHPLAAHWREFTRRR